jgi:metal-responsive CopG/Arc/MetJ family transcriptional regulator
MRLHITLRPELVKELDRRVGRRRRSGFIAHAVTLALDDQRRWELIETSIGAIAEGEHDWDRDPAAWVRHQRRADDRRVG